MHDMPRIITYTTSGVLRLLVVYDRCGVCVRTKSVMKARKSDLFFFSKKAAIPPSIQSSHHRKPPQSQIVVQNVPAGIATRFLHMFAKAKDSSFHTWSLRRERSASEIWILIVEADLVFWLSYDLRLFGNPSVFCSCSGGVDASLRYKSCVNISEGS